MLKHMISSEQEYTLNIQDKLIPLRKLTFKDIHVNVYWIFAQELQVNNPLYTKTEISGYKKTLKLSFHRCTETSVQSLRLKYYTE